MSKQDAARWRGLKSLLHDAVDVTTRLVEVGSDSTMRSVFQVTDRIDGVRQPVRFVDGVRRLSTGSVLSTIRGVNRLVAAVSDSALDAVQTAAEKKAALSPDSATPSAAPNQRAADVALGVINAAVGDHLSESRNSLDLAMAIRFGDRYVQSDRESLSSAAPGARPKVALFVHGLGTTEASWGVKAPPKPDDHRLCFGAELERDLGFTPAYLRYNTGRRVSQNGRLLAENLEEFVQAYPLPIDDLTLVGHSMGGLVLRSACHYGAEAKHSWPAKVRRVFYLGTPHQGAPLSRLGHAVGSLLDAVDLPATKIIGRIVASRSAGIHDLREGSVIDGASIATGAEKPDETTLLATARHYFISATVTANPNHPIGRAFGDLLVQVASAHGPAQMKATPSVDTICLGGLMHHELQRHPSVYAQLRSACSPVPDLLIGRTKANRSGAGRD